MTELFQPGDIVQGKDIRGRYEIVALLGEGALGEVYTVKHATITPNPLASYGSRFKSNEALVLKITKPGDDLESLTISANEAEALRCLNHPGIPRVIAHFPVSVGNFDCYGIVMDRIPGVTLEDLIEKQNTIPNFKVIDSQQAVNITLKLCDILRACHNVGVIHRDIKPGQITFTQTGEVYLLDFGNAKITSKNGATNNGTINNGTISLVPMGTPGYCCLEQYKHEEATPAFDIYSLGAVLYEMLTGEKPVDILVRFADKKCRFPEHKKVPKNLKKILEKMLAKEKKDQYQTVEQVETDLKKEQEKILDATIPFGSRIKKYFAALAISTQMYLNSAMGQSNGQLNGQSSTQGQQSQRAPMHPAQQYIQSLNPPTLTQYLATTTQTTTNCQSVQSQIQPGQISPAQKYIPVQMNNSTIPPVTPTIYVPTFLASYLSASNTQNIIPPSKILIPVQKIPADKSLETYIADKLGEVYNQIDDKTIINYPDDQKYIFSLIEPINGDLIYNKIKIDVGLINSKYLSNKIYF